MSTVRPRLARCRLSLDSGASPTSSAEDQDAATRLARRQPGWGSGDSYNVWSEGFEPSASYLASRRSNRTELRPHWGTAALQRVRGKGTRTPQDNRSAGSDRTTASDSGGLPVATCTSSPEMDAWVGIQPT